MVRKVETRDGGAPESASLTIWIGSERRRRLATLKASGSSINVSKVCQDALDKAMDTEEEAHSHSRIARVLARLRETRPPQVRAFDTGQRAGRLWAEEVATLSEMRSLAAIRSHTERKRCVAVNELQTEVISLTWYGDQGEEVVETMPPSVPAGFFRQAQESAYGGELVGGFIDGAAFVHELVEQALNREQQEEDHAARDGGPRSICEREGGV